MTNEEFEKRKRFILERRAQFAADMGKLREAQAKTERVVARIRKIVAQASNRVTKGSKDVNGKVDSQKLTMEDLKNLIAALEHYLSERRKGN